MAGNKKAGPVTLALSLIFFGFVLLTANFTGTGILTATLKYWPVLLIGLGAEYFIRSYLNRKNNPAGAKGIVKLSSGKGAINLSTENGNITVDKY